MEHAVTLDITATQASPEAAAAANSSDKPYPLWRRMLIILGGSVLLWAVIGMSVGLAAQPRVVGAFLKA